MAVQLKFDELFFRCGKISGLTWKRSKTKSVVRRYQPIEVRKPTFQTLFNDPKCIVKKGLTNLEGLSYYDFPDFSRFQKVVNWTDRHILNSFSTKIKNPAIWNQIKSLKIINEFFKDPKIKHTLQMTKKEKQRKIASYFSFK